MLTRIPCTSAGSRAIMHAFELGTVHCLPPRPVAAKPPVCISRRSHSRAQCRPERAGDARHTSTEVVYKDSWTDLAFIALCRRAYGDLAGWQSSRSWRDGTETFAGMVEVSRALMKGKTAAEQRDAVVAGFPRIPSWFRKLFPYSKWGAQLNARITPTFFTWLVGPMQTEDVEIEGQGTMRSAVHIEKCRYLAESNCVGMCQNLCKVPVQHFFTQELGMPLTMNPNFEDKSCKMIFGQQPPPLEEDEASQQPCLHDCQMATSSKRKCNKLQ